MPKTRFREIFSDVALEGKDGYLLKYLLCFLVMCSDILNNANSYVCVGQHGIMSLLADT